MSELRKMSKEELSEKLNKLLGTNNIDFTKMSRKDLVQLHEVLSDLLKPLSEMSLREVLDELFGDRPLRQRLFPRARKRIREILRGSEREEEGA